MPLCDRGDLKATMKRLFRAGQYFAEPRLRGLLSQLLSAVAHLKAHRIVHRDIKAVSAPFPSFVRPVLTEISLCHTCSCPEILRVQTVRQDNIMLQSCAPSGGGGGGGGAAQEERLVLIDFGQCLDCAHYQLDGFKMPMLTPMSRGGAPGFLAPEVVTPRPGPRTVIDYAKNDDWAVGMLLYAMLAGPGAPPDPFSSGDDPRRFADANYRPLDLRNGGYADALGELVRGLLQVSKTAGH
jgi:serine/threonine protein kinase